MPKSLEERVSYLEGTVGNNSRNIEDLRELMIQLNRRVDRLDEKVDRFRKELSERISALEESTNARLSSFEESTNARFSSLEESTNARFSSLETRMDALDEKMSRQFMWIVGIQVAILLAVVGALLGG